MRKTLWLTALTVVLGVVCAVPAMAQSGGTYAGVVPYGALYQDLSVEWWQWALSMPVRMPVYSGTVYNPEFDTTGAAAWNEQPHPDTVFFLAGVMGAFDSATGALIGAPSGKLVKRDITIPTTARLFVPIVNFEMDNVGVMPPVGVPRLYESLDPIVAGVGGMYVVVDGKPVANLLGYRTISRPFSYCLPAQDNVYQLFGVNVAGTLAPAVGDGYYVLLEPLPPGKHTLESGGTAWEGTFVVHVRYTITVPSK